MTYEGLEEHVELGLTKQVGEHLEVGVQIHAERECGEAETNVTQDSKIQSKDVIGEYRQVDVGANVNEGSRIMELAIGDGIFSEARSGSGCV